MKKVLIITYYWVPSGGSGVQRWLKFSKYLPEFGWQPVIYTPENPDLVVTDESLQDDIPEELIEVKTKIWEPYSFFRMLVGRKKDQKTGTGFLLENKSKSWIDKLALTIRGNFLIPDPRKFWIKPSVRFLKKYLKQNSIDTVITTGPPHSMHMIALKLKKYMPDIKWIADFRDPWTDIDFYKELNLSKCADRKHHKLENKVLKAADEIIVVTKTMQGEYERKAGKKVHLITNGFDESDYSNIGDIQLDDKFSISHIGTFNEPRNPIAFWEVLSELCSENPEFKKDLSINLVGNVDYAVMQSLNENNLIDNTVKIDYLPHSDAIKHQLKSQVLLLVINRFEKSKGVLTAKVFEYIAANRPIIAFGPEEADAELIINETQSGVFIHYDDKNKIKETVLDFYQKYKQKTLNNKSSNYLKYSRKQLTKRLVEEVMG
ncbi:MAG: glycosyltransferase [Bacteroidales bacterium]